MDELPNPEEKTGRGMPRPYRDFGEGNHVPLGSVKNLPLTGEGLGVGGGIATKKATELVAFALSSKPAMPCVAMF